MSEVTDNKTESTEMEVEKDTDASEVKMTDDSDATTTKSENVTAEESTVQEIKKEGEAVTDDAPTENGDKDSISTNTTVTTTTTDADPKEGNEHDNSDTAVAAGVVAEDNNNNADDVKAETDNQEETVETPVVIPDFLAKITPELSIPKGSIKRVLKTDKTIKISTSDAVYLIAKAAECFVTELAHLTAAEAKKNSTRKVIQYEDVRNAYEAANGNGKDWRFLEGILPPQKKRQKTNTN
eukprot:g918.t1